MMAFCSTCLNETVTGFCSGWTTNIPCILVSIVAGIITVGIIILIFLSKFTILPCHQFKAPKVEDKK